MSLTSLADAPLLIKPAGDAGLSLPRSRSCKLKEDQASIDALFQEDVGMQVDKTHAERKNIPPAREPPSSARNFELKSNQGEAVLLPALLPLSQQAGDFSKKRPPKQDDCLFSKTRDASDVLAGFLADTSINMNVNKPSGLSLLEDVKKDQREDFKSKWNSYSPQPLGRLPTLTFSPRLASGSTLSTPDSLEPSISPMKLTSDNLSSFKKDEKWAARKDVLFLLPDKSNESAKEGALSDNSSYAPTTSCQNVDEENSDFGGYQPSCLSMTTPIHPTQRRHLTSFLTSSETFDEKEAKMDVAEKHKKGYAPSIMVDNVSDQTALHQQGGPCTKDVNNCHIDVFRRNPSPVQDSTTEKIYIDPCSVSLSSETVAQEKPGCSAELQRLRDENLALREEIMKIEAEKLKIEKEFLEKELLCEPQGAHQASLEKEEAQKIAEELALELLTVKQSLSLTEEKVECMKKVHDQEIEMLKNMHTMELERRDKQLCMEKELVAEKKGAIESFSQLLLKADEWSAKIDELHKSMVCEKAAQPTEGLNRIANIESTVSEHESSLQVMEKRSTEVCNQLEKVAIMLDNARKDMERLQKQEEQCISSSHDQLQAFQSRPLFEEEREQEEALDPQTTSIDKSMEKGVQIHDPCLQEEQIWLSRFLEEKKDLELERETVLCMREQISQADATLRKQLHEHAVRMQTEAEEMARQKRELEHARNIAAEIALQVENSRRELEMYKTTLNKTLPEGPPSEDSLTAYLAPQWLPKLGRKLELSRRYEHHRRPYSSADVHRNSFYGTDMLEPSKPLQSEDAVIQEVQEGMYYIRAQEEFLIQAEKALEGMSFNKMCVPIANF